MTILLAGKEFKGQWVYMQRGGIVGTESGSAYAGNRSIQSEGTYSEVFTAGGGTMQAVAADGSSLRCTFDYNQASETGIGQCRDNRGEFYDLQIH
jgi:hypothetical protein